MEILDKQWEHEKEHKQGYIDCFRISTNRKIQVKLTLSMRARNLMIEEYPLSEKEIIETKNNRYVFESNVCNFLGVGRFVLGLMDDVKVIAPIELKKYLNHKVNNKSFL